MFANAGIAGGTPLGVTTLEAFEKVISTNLTAVFFTVQSALPHLNDNASIILNGSVISVLGIPGYAAYGAAKAGVRAMARDHGVGIVAARHPRQRGGARRDPHADLGRRDRDAGSRGSALRSGSADRRRSAASASPITVAKTVLFLASDDAAHVQGQEMFVDGGARPLRAARRSIGDRTS